MGKDDKEETGFGFKDKAKAVETLRLLESHEPNYRRLTVRGLLGRAKRVLSMTKAEDKIKNIKEAMQVFEDWLADLDKNKDKKPDKKEKKEEKETEKNDEKDEKATKRDSEQSKDLPSGSVPGLGFKDKETAEKTLKELEGRDPDYQKLAIKGLIKRAENVLLSTADKEKLSNIKEAIAIFNKFIDDFETNHLSKQNNNYISLGIVQTCVKLAGENISDQQRAFIAAYSSVKGEYKRLRTVASDSGKTWDIVRNVALAELKDKHKDAKLFRDNDDPTPEHLEMLLWAYSPEAAKVKKVITEPMEEDEPQVNTRKRKLSEDGESPSKKRIE